MYMWYPRLSASIVLDHCLNLLFRKVLFKHQLLKSACSIPMPHCMCTVCDVHKQQLNHVNLCEYYMLHVCDTLVIKPIGSRYDLLGVFTQHVDL